MSLIYASSKYQWTLSPYSNSLTDFAWLLSSSGSTDSNYVYYSIATYPVLNLKPNLTLSGTGTSTDSLYNYK